MNFEGYVALANAAAKANIYNQVLKSGTQSKDLQDKLDNCILFSACEDETNEDYYNIWQNLKQGFKTGQDAELLGIKFSNYLLSQGWSL